MEEVFLMNKPDRAAFKKSLTGNLSELDNISMKKPVLKGKISAPTPPSKSLEEPPSHIQDQDKDLALADNSEFEAFTRGTPETPSKILDIINNDSAVTEEPSTSKINPLDVMIRASEEVSLLKTEAVKVVSASLTALDFEVMFRNPEDNKNYFIRKGAFYVLEDKEIVKLSSVPECVSDYLLSDKIVSTSIISEGELKKSDVIKRSLNIKLDF